MQRISKDAEPFRNRCKAKHSIDDHDHHRHLVPSIEGTWATDFWEDRCFQFIVAISEVSAKLAHKRWVLQGESDVTVHQFRRKLAIGLINNDHVADDSETQKKDLDCSVVIVNIFIRVHRVVLNRTTRRAKHGLGQQKI